MRAFLSALIFSFFAAAGPLHASNALAQGFMVQPMTMLSTPSPRERVEVPLQIFNTAIDGPRTILLKLVGISQNELGGWELDENAADIEGRSAVPWSSLSESAVTIAPQQPAQVIVSVAPPPDARGAYFAAVVAETPVPEGQTGIVIRTRFLIPLVVEVSGRAARQIISLDDLVLTKLPPSSQQAATTTVHMVVTNSGRTFSRVKGEITVDRLEDTNWRTVTRVPVDERGIIPGVKLKLGTDLQRRLPSGQYRLRGELRVDGRRVPPLEKITTFVGDPAASVAYDATLKLSPSTLSVDALPGATRTAVVKVENTGSDPVEIDIAPRIPRSLAGVRLGALLGTDLSAAGWTRIQPSKFTLRPNRSQNVRVVSRIPDGVDEYANYFADLVISGKYSDGQSAGETVAKVKVRNIRVTGDPQAVIDRASLSEAGIGTYNLDATVVNDGMVDFTPTVGFQVVNSESETILSGALSNDAGVIIPLEKRVFSSDLDASLLPVGNYAIKINVKAPTEQVSSRTFQITVEEGEDGGRVVSLRDDVTDAGPTPAGPAGITGKS